MLPDVPGVQAGHWTGAETGVTVVVFPEGTVGSVEIRGGAPATRETADVRLGDLGAASMPTAVAIACEGFRRGAPRAATCLITGSSPYEDRGALLLAHV